MPTDCVGKRSENLKKEGGGAIFPSIQYIHICVNQSIDIYSFSIDHQTEREQGYRSSGLSGDEDGVSGKKKKKKKGALLCRL